VSDAGAVALALPHRARTALVRDIALRHLSDSESALLARGASSSSSSLLPSSSASPTPRAAAPLRLGVRRRLGFALLSQRSNGDLHTSPSAAAKLRLVGLRVLLGRQPDPLGEASDPATGAVDADDEHGSGSVESSRDHAGAPADTKLTPAKAIAVAARPPSPPSETVGNTFHIVAVPPRAEGVQRSLFTVAARGAPSTPDTVRENAGLGFRAALQRVREALDCAGTAVSVTGASGSERARTQRVGARLDALEAAAGRIDEREHGLRCATAAVLAELVALRKLRDAALTQALAWGEEDEPSAKMLVLDLGTRTSLS
jgi:hypothetical protein